MKNDFVPAIDEDGSPVGMLKLVYSPDRIDVLSKKTGRKILIAMVSEKHRGYVKQWGVVSPYKKRDVRFVENKAQAISLIQRMAAPYLIWEQARAS